MAPALLVTMVMAMQIVFLLIGQYTVLSHVQPGIGNWVEITGMIDLSRLKDLILSHNNSERGRFIMRLWDLYATDLQSSISSKFNLSDTEITRMYSNRMRTGRSLTVSRSLLPGGVSALRGVCLLPGGSGPRGGVCSRGVVCLLRGCVSALRGVSAPGGGGCSWGRGGVWYPSMY